jgi:hypothetical protein
VAIQSHPKYKELMTLVDSLITQTKKNQEKYFIAKGKYFQGLKTPPADGDGVAVASPDIALHPDDQAESWNSFDPAEFKAQAKLPFNIRIDVYQAPTGWGWWLTIELWYNALDPDAYGNRGSHWIYRHSEGPETPQGIWDDWFVIDDSIFTRATLEGLS